MLKSRSVGGSLREGWRESDIGRTPKIKEPRTEEPKTEGKRPLLDTDVQLEKKSEYSSRKFSRGGLILGRQSSASSGAAESSGGRNVFLARDQNGLVWSILNVMISGGVWRFWALLACGAVGF